MVQLSLILVWLFKLSLVLSQSKSPDVQEVERTDREDSPPQSSYVVLRPFDWSSLKQETASDGSKYDTCGVWIWTGGSVGIFLLADPGLGRFHEVWLPETDALAQPKGLHVGSIQGSGWHAARDEALKMVLPKPGRSYGRRWCTAQERKLRAMWWGKRLIRYSGAGKAVIAVGAGAPVVAGSGAVAMGVLMHKGSRLRQQAMMEEAKRGGLHPKAGRGGGDTAPK